MAEKIGCCTTSKNYQEHWNTAYAQKPTENLGWYEAVSQQTLDLITATQIDKNATILNVGSGSSTLIDSLIFDGYSNIIANDISSEALNSLKQRLGENSKNVQFLQDDLINPKALQNLQVDVWNDRAVLHFFLKEDEQNSYFNLLKKVVKPNGFVIIAVFAHNGAEKCCGLPLKRYKAEMLQEKLGNNFKLLKTFNYTFINPNGGERPYIYTLFQRNL